MPNLPNNKQAIEDGGVVTKEWYRFFLELQTQFLELTQSYTELKTEFDNYVATHP